MRAFAILAISAVTLAASVPAALAAELEPQAEACQPGTVWNGDRCVRRAPRVYSGPPVYEDEAVAVTPPVVVAAPPVYVEPFYAGPAVTFYAGPRYWAGGYWGGPHYWGGPRYVWGGRYWGPGHQHWRQHRGQPQRHVHFQRQGGRR